VERVGDASTPLEQSRIGRRRQRLDIVDRLRRTAQVRELSRRARALDQRIDQLEPRRMPAAICETVLPEGDLPVPRVQRRRCRGAERPSGIGARSLAAARRPVPVGTVGAGDTGETDHQHDADGRREPHRGTARRHASRTKDLARRISADSPRHRSVSIIDPVNEDRQRRDRELR
jgi:hypothetical protein